jgi:hypothetical protein
VSRLETTEYLMLKETMHRRADAYLIARRQNPDESALNFVMAMRRAWTSAPTYAGHDAESAVRWGKEAHRARYVWSRMLPEVRAYFKIYGQPRPLMNMDQLIARALVWDAEQHIVAFRRLAAGQGEQPVARQREGEGVASSETVLSGGKVGDSSGLGNHGGDGGGNSEVGQGDLSRTRQRSPELGESPAATRRPLYLYPLASGGLAGSEPSNRPTITPSKDTGPTLRRIGSTDVNIAGEGNWRWSADDEI